jgi:nicotinate phosphoribosyltransferase
VNGLLTDLYELTMAAGFHQAGKQTHGATFELSIRRLPSNRNYAVFAGLPQAVEYLQQLSFTSDEIEYLRGLPQFRQVKPDFFDYLREFRFTGDLFAVPEGTPMFAGEPVLSVRAPLIQAQIPETYLLSAITFQTLIASKAARIAEAAAGRNVVEFGTRRAHTPEAGIYGARAAYIGGCTGTSNALAGFRFGIPVFGTSAHSWVMAFCGETQAFRHLQSVLGPAAVQLIDTYDTLEGARKAASLGKPLWGVRLDSGNVLELSRSVRDILDEAGLHDTKIMVSGDLDEYKIRDLVTAGAPIDSFGVGTQLATSADAPSMSAIYKMAELDICGIKRFTAKLSEDKTSLPGAKQVFRHPDHDVVARSGECNLGRPLLRPILLGGELVEPLPALETTRAYTAECIRSLAPALRQLELSDPYDVRLSKELKELVNRTRENLKHV